jgi:hypothetical protein
MVFWGCILLATILLCRFVPGPKCMTFCAYKKVKYKNAVNELEKYAMWNNSICIGANFKDTKTKKLIQLYQDSSPFGCSELTIGTWVKTTREALKETIAERLLLDH